MMLRQATLGAARAANTRTFATSAARQDLARMQLLGRLVADPEQRTSRNGKDFMKYTVATTDPLGPPNEDGERPQPTTSFHNVFAFGNENQQKYLSTLTKGTQLLVDADFRVQYQPSDGDEPGRTNYLINHRNVTVISRPKPAGDAASSDA